MKKIYNVLVAALMLIAVWACGTSTSDLADQVKDHMNETWKEQGIELRCKTITLVHKSGNQYNGIATVSGYGETEDVNVEVTCDGETFLWQIVE